MAMLQMSHDDSVLTKHLSTIHQHIFLDDRCQTLATETYPSGSYHWYQTYWLTPISDDSSIVTQAPKVLVCLGLFGYDYSKSFLDISYFVEKTPLIDLTIHCNHFKQADFLWQENCLECFVEYDGADGYFEFNMALDGRHNLYHFDHYRTPNTMPPRQANPNDVLTNISQVQDVADGFYSRHAVLTNTHNTLPTRLNPTIILYPDGGQPIFYAKNHANPPDFHHKQYWQYPHIKNQNA